MTCTCFKPSTEALLALPMKVKAHRVPGPLSIASCRYQATADGLQKNSSLGFAKTPARFVP